MSARKSLPQATAMLPPSSVHENAFNLLSIHRALRPLNDFSPDGLPMYDTFIVTQYLTIPKRSNEEVASTMQWGITKYVHSALYRVPVGEDDGHVIHPYWCYLIDESTDEMGWAYSDASDPTFYDRAYNNHPQVLPVPWVSDPCPLTGTRYTGPSPPRDASSSLVHDCGAVGGDHCESSPRPQRLLHPSSPWHHQGGLFPPSSTSLLTTA